MSWLDTLEEIRTRDFSKASTEDRDRTAREVVNLCSYAVAVVSISPLPFSDALLMLPIQTGMVMSIGHIYGREVGKAEATDLIVEIGAIAGVSFLARQGIKALLPVVGALLTVPAAFAANWGMGRVAMEYFRHPGLSKDAIKAIYEEAKREGSSMFSKDSFDRFRKKNADDISKMAEDEQEQRTEQAMPAPPPPAAAASERPKSSKTIGRKKAGGTSRTSSPKGAKKTIGKKK